MTDNLARLIDTKGITAVVNYFNDNLQDDVSVPHFYNRQLLDKIKIAPTEYKHLSYAKDGTVPQGHQKIKYRRWGTLTAHSIPLVEGIPPISDMTNVESIEGTYNQYGRYMEFTDKVSFSTIDPIIVQYTQELSDVAVRTLERLARAELLSATNENFANKKANKGALRLTDQVSFTDYRLHALLLERLQVKKINGAYDILISPEHYYDLLMDPLVKEYLTLTQSGKPYVDGQLPPLFNLRFVKHQLDEYTYGYELSNPGEWHDGSNYYLNVYYKDPATGDSYYFNIPDTYRYEFTDRGDTPNAVDIKGVNRLSNGSYIPTRVVWDIVAWKAASASVSVQKIDGTTGAETTEAAFDASDKPFIQLPIHTSIMLGMDALIKTGIDGKTGAGMYVKPLGSAGVLDPINQRQSIGFKIDAVGFLLMRDECCSLFHHVPVEAPLTANVFEYTLGATPGA